MEDAWGWALQRSLNQGAAPAEADRIRTRPPTFLCMGGLAASNMREDFLVQVDAVILDRSSAKTPGPNATRVGVPDRPAQLSRRSSLGEALKSLRVISPIIMNCPQMALLQLWSPGTEGLIVDPSNPKDPNRPRCGPNGPRLLSRALLSSL